MELVSDGSIRVAVIVIIAMTSLYLTSIGIEIVNPHPFNENINSLRVTTISTRNISNDSGAYEEVKHIAFLKVHKAASSTLQNIFLRFGWQRNLTFVLPPIKNPSGFRNVISLHEPMTKTNILAAPLGRNYDIMCNHVFYSYASFVHVMPKDTVFIAVIREPFERFKSTLDYFRPVNIYKNIKGPNQVGQFLKNPKRYEMKGRISNSYINNRMAQEFGFPKELFKRHDTVGVKEYLKKLDREFHLVLVADMFDESCVIMRRRLRWQTRDVMFINQHIGNKTTSILPTFNEIDLFKQYARLDYDIYKYFYLRLRKEIRSEGSDFDEELLFFKEMRLKVKDHCASDTNANLHVPSSPWGHAFTVDKVMCGDMTRKEMEFVDLVRERQYGTNSTDSNR